MVVFMGGLAVRAAIEGSDSGREALSRVVGRAASPSSDISRELGRQALKRDDYFVVASGSRMARTRTRAERNFHVHVDPSPDGNPDAVLLVMTDRGPGGREGSVDRRGHHGATLLLRKPPQGELRRVELALLEEMKRARKARGTS
jgi:hypothetical protein